MHHYLYKTINLINSKYYIGIHSTNDLSDGYIGTGKLLKQAIKKYGKENFKNEIIIFFSTKEKAYSTERQVVSQEFVEQKNNYNLRIGGIGGNGKWTEERKKAFSDSKKGNNNIMYGTISPRVRSVIDIETGVFYISGFECWKHNITGYSYSNFSWRLRNSICNRWKY